MSLSRSEKRLPQENRDIELRIGKSIKDQFARRYGFTDENQAHEIGLTITKCPCGCGDYTFTLTKEFSLGKLHFTMVRV